MTKIVVGIDGSEGSIAALEFAVGEARLRDAEIEAIIAWELPATAVPPTGAWAIPIDFDAFRREAEAHMRKTLERVDTSGIHVASVVVEGPAAGALISAARDAAMVVVGSRGRGGFMSLLLGSVSTQIAHHATCPVVIVPTPGTR
jgi:nucleotide-binding universal stress UspA family protein